MKIFVQLENGQLIDDEGCVYDLVELPKETMDRIFREMEEEANYENTKQKI